LIFASQAISQEDPDPLAIRAAFAKALDGHNPEEYLSFLTEDAVWDWVSQPAPLVGHEQIGAVFGIQIAASPDDWNTDQGHVMSVDNLVVVEHAAFGTQTGTLPEPGELPPSGNEWAYPHLDIYEIEGDKIQRLTTYGDDAGVFVQWGLMPAPEPIALISSMDPPAPKPTGLSPLEANAELIERWNAADVHSVTEMVHADYTVFAAPLGSQLNRSELMAMSELFFDAFPQSKVEVVRVLDMSDGWVLTELVSRGSYVGSFMGVPPTGYPIELRLVWLCHYDSNGLLTQKSFYYDNLTLMNQMTTAPEYSPAGTWVSTVATPVGNMTFLHTVSPQEKMGVPYAGIMHPVSGNATLFGMFSEVEKATDYVTQTVRTGRNTCVSTMLNYGTKKGEGPVDEIATIAILHVKWPLTGPETNEGTTILSVYLAEQDADCDGFPDEGQEPVECMPFTFTTRRLTMMPPCTLPYT